MADLPGGGGGRTGNGNSVPRMPQAAPAPTGSPSGRSGIRGPTDIMRERNQREARRKAEQEQIEMERARAEEENRLVEEDRRRRAEKRASAAGVAGGGVGDRDSGGTAGGYRSSGSAAGANPLRISDQSQRTDRTSGGERPAGTIQGRGRGGSALGGGETVQPTTRRPNPNPDPLTPVAQSAPIPPPQGRTASSQAQPGPSAVPQANQPAPATAQPTEGASNRRGTQSSFPHAFERWETLSAHWEGLTGFWMRRLEENSRQISADPLSQQLSRQVTDLSAAGANLFHAVVELQRLRASSERKFQRWFFETRAEQERSAEMLGQLEAALEDERRGRAASIEEALAHQAELNNIERERNSHERMLTEMRRELAISKEEAKRAWEELGRREQEERDRMVTIKEGNPIMIGGVQVLPVMGGAPSRHGSQRQPQSQSQRLYDPPPVGSMDDPFTSSALPTTTATSNTLTAPSVYTPTTTSTAPAVQQPTTTTAGHSIGSFYQNPNTSLHGPGIPNTQRTNPNPTDHSRTTGATLSEPYSEPEDVTEYEIDASGQFRRNSRGERMPYRGAGTAGTLSDEDDDEDDEAFEARERERERELAGRYGGNQGAYSANYAASGGGVMAGQGQGRGGGVIGGRRGGGAVGGAVGGGGGGGGGGGPSGGLAAEEYTAQGYPGLGWEEVPRHHHPTRLSDVLEEDERSRTSASMVSRSRE